MKGEWLKWWVQLKKRMSMRCLIVLVNGVALEREIGPVMLTALTLVSYEAEDVIETEELEEVVAVTTLALTAASRRTYSWRRR